MPLLQKHSIALDERNDGVKNTDSIVTCNGKPVNKFLTDKCGNTVGPSSHREPYGRYFLNNDKQVPVILEPGEQKIIEDERQERKKNPSLALSVTWQEVESRVGSIDSLKLDRWYEEVISDEELATRENFKKVLDTHFSVEEPFRGNWMITPSKNS